jgi:hypothetical protein
MYILHQVAGNRPLKLSAVLNSFDQVRRLHLSSGNRAYRLEKTLVKMVKGMGIKCIGG